ncbi:MAG: serine/threonine-protein kinase [Planctomycetota bacterium]
MTQHNVADPVENLTVTAHVPLSERPLVAEDENTVISVPEQSRPDVRAEGQPINEQYRQRLFPASGLSNGEEAGIRLAHFEIVSRLGSGGMGAVFRAVDLELARDVALKILHPSSSQDTSLVARFRNEARACAQLNHDNIARVFYAGSQEGLYFIAYEFASGQTIRDLIIDRGRLSIEDTVNYAIQVTLALNHIAAAGIVHRDIKPSNIMLTHNGRVKVVDLGLARRDITDSIGDITVAGTTLGTFDYISPEQARDPRNADVRSDIYSLGCTMYHMLTGQPPYPEGTALQKLLDHQGKSPPDPCILNPGIPPELAAIIRKMMSNNPDHRYSVPGLLLNDLIQMAALLGLRSVPAEGIVWRKTGMVTPKQPIGAVWVFVSVLLICLTAMFLKRSERLNELAIEMAQGESLPGEEVRPENYPEIIPEVSASAAIAMNSSNGQSSATGANEVVRSDGAISGAASSPAEVNPASNESGVSDASISTIPNGGVISSQLLQMIANPPAAQGAVPRSPEVPADPFVLQTADGATRSFRTLKAAVADAKSGDVVLLRYNGYPDDLPAQPPVRLVGMNLTIRAAEGFRPTLVFDGISEGTVTPGQMFNLRSRGSLNIRDIDLRLIVRDDFTADRWSLFHCEGPNRIHLENVSIECRNPDAQPVAIFDLTNEPAGPAESSGIDEWDFSLSKVICRADADAFRIACQPQGRIQFRNCALALNGSLMELRGDSSMQPMRGSLELFLDHVTCLHSTSMIQMSEGDDRSGGAQRMLPRLSIRSEASVFTGIGLEPRLLTSQGSSYVDDTESLVSWNGFTNLYDGYNVFWLIETSALDFSGRRLDFAQWSSLWQNRPDSEDTNSMSTPLIWHNPVWKDTGLRFSLDDLTPSVFELDAAQFNSGPLSLPKARDGLIPGAVVQELPPFPRTKASSAAESGSVPEAVSPGTPGLISP